MQTTWITRNKRNGWTLAILLISSCVLTGCEPSRLASSRRGNRNPDVQQADPAPIFPSASLRKSHASSKSNMDAEPSSLEKNKFSASAPAPILAEAGTSTLTAETKSGLSFALAEELVLVGSNPFLSKLPNPDKTANTAKKIVSVPPPNQSRIVGPGKSFSADLGATAQSAEVSPLESVQLLGIVYSPENPLALISDTTDNSNQFVSRGKVVSIHGEMLKVLSVNRDNIILARLHRGNARNKTSPQQRTYYLQNIVGYQSTKGNSGTGRSVNLTPRVPPSSPTASPRSTSTPSGDQPTSKLDGATISRFAPFPGVGENSGASPSSKPVISLPSFSSSADSNNSNLEPLKEP